jgi:hypothetical protein
MVIAVFQQLPRPVERFGFAAKIFCPRYSFEVRRVGRGGEAVVIGEAIDHIFPYGDRQDIGIPQTYPEIQASRADALKDQSYRADQSIAYLRENADARQGRRGKSFAATL